LIGVTAEKAALAGFILNGDFETVSGSGSPLTVVGPTGTYPSAASDWLSLVAVPNSHVSTELIPSTDPFPGGGGLMLHVITENGIESTGSFGGGVVFPFSSPFPSGGTISFDIMVVAGDITAGVSFGPFITPVGAPAGTGWQRFSYSIPQNQSVSAFAAENLNQNEYAEFYLDHVTFVPEPSTIVLAGFGIALLAANKRNNTRKDKAMRRP
jgi:hypothetical protein